MYHLLYYILLPHLIFKNLPCLCIIRQSAKFLGQVVKENHGFFLKTWIILLWLCVCTTLFPIKHILGLVSVIKQWKTRFFLLLIFFFFLFLIKKNVLNNDKCRKLRVGVMQERVCRYWKWRIKILRYFESNETMTTKTKKIFYGRKGFAKYSHTLAKSWMGCWQIWWQ